MSTNTDETCPAQLADNIARALAGLPSAKEAKAANDKWNSECDALEARMIALIAKQNANHS